MSICYIALGSNSGRRADFIRLALEYLEKDPAVNVLKVSSLIETEPENSLPQRKFLNAAAKLETRYSARELLGKLQEIEVQLGREALHPRNQPRTIDLDILLFGDLKIDEHDLKIPHPRMWQREFVMVPLREIAPESAGEAKRGIL
jgi:2-amino-4-hydroxy-6-hydroxymethyldihydropteridine diphosphokinase